MAHVLTPSAQYGTTGPPASDVDAGLLEMQLKQAVDGEVRFDKTSRALYATDASNYRQVPIGVVVPRTVDAVVNTMAVCHRLGAPIVSRGCGTSLAGQCCNVAVVIDFSKYINHILSIDPEQRVARVQPGVYHDKLAKHTVEPYHLTYGPDPSTHGYCTFGGMIGNNACGVHSVMSGRTVDNVHSMEIVTYDGLRMRVGETSEEELEAIIREGGRRGEIYRGLKKIRDDYGDLIRERFPDIPRRVSGYNLDELLPENGFNVARALVGSEGTCVTMLDADVRLVDSPPVRSLVVLGYEDVYSAGDHVSEVLKHEPLGLEGMDRRLMDYMLFKDMSVGDVRLLPEGDGWLLVEFGGESREEADAKARDLMEALEKKDNAPSTALFTDHNVMETIWDMRESGLGATAFVPNNPDTWPGWEDAAVDPARLGDYLREFRGLLRKYDYDAALYGHFGDGCVHCRINFNLTSHDGIEHYRRFLDEAADLVVEHDGSLTAEHGDGQSRGELLPKMYGEELIQGFREFKAIWDPDGRMNPGKVIDPYPITHDLRLGPDFDPATPDTFFKYPDDNQSFWRATMRCVGVGKCRMTEDTFMCPSFLVTREEKHTTRGRAHALFEMASGRFITDGWRSDEVKETLDLCLACKGCKRDCPVDVDLATLKAEFLAHYYEGRLRPRDFYAMGMIGTWAKFGSLAPSVTNWFARTRPFDSVAKWAAGMSQHRKVPEFAPQTFMQWFRKRGGSKVDGPPVLLFPDVFNNHFFPETLSAATRVLEHFGYRVEVPKKRPPGLRPLIHYGMLETAREKLIETMEMLRPYAGRDVPIVGLEPSTVAVFRDEVPNFFPGDQNALRISHDTVLLSEFLAREDLDLPQAPRKAIFHGHCHQKAVLKQEQATKVLREMNMEVEEPEPGCCGMAGSFGFEAKHYDLSVQIAELNLVPAIRKAADDTLIVIEGFSCHEQIKQETGRRPLHFAEVIDQAIAGRL